MGYMILQRPFHIFLPSFIGHPRNTINQINGNILKIGRTKKPLIIPIELQEALDKNSILANHFESMSLTNKRDFAEYILTAKRTVTKKKRIDKIIPMILQNIGLNDKYKK